MTHSEVIKTGDTYLLSRISKLYDLAGYEIMPIEAHEGGRNVVYICEKEGADAIIIRISFEKDRNKEQLLGELEFVRYLYENGCSVSDVINSSKGDLLEEIIYDNNSFFITLFKKAKGKMLVENNYKYRENAPLTEYFYNCGKTLGNIHQLSKSYKPIHYRYSFFDKYNAEYIDKLIPNSLSLLKKKLIELLKTIEELDVGNESFGLIHFDYSDGNYNIDFDNGQITVYDFDNSCYCWYMFDLAGLWKHGVGWVQFEKDIDKRKKFMDEYFETILAGYKSETSIEESMLEKLQLFIQVCLLENIVDSFEVMRNNNQKPECNEELSYIIKCVLDDIPYMGFFHEIYSCDNPFKYEEQKI